MAPTNDGESPDMKRSRLEQPSGWLTLTRYETVRLLVDALLEAPPEYEFNKSELERRTGLSREAIREHIPLLVDLGVVEEVDTGGWTEYRLNDDGKVTKELFELNSAVNSVLSGEPAELQDDVPSRLTLSDFSTDVEHDRQSGPGASLVDNSHREREDDVIGQGHGSELISNAD